jgi:hypothetical protein
MKFDVDLPHCNCPTGSALMDRFLKLSIFEWSGEFLIAVFLRG